MPQNERPDRLPDYMIPTDDDGHYLAIYVEPTKWSDLFPEAEGGTVYVNGEAVEITRVSGTKTNEEIMERAKIACRRIHLVGE